MSTREPLATYDDEIWGFWSFVSFVSIAALVLIFVGIGAYMASQREQQESVRLNTFLAECIAFHSEKRCKEFWRYNRPDLGRKP